MSVDASSPVRHLRPGETVRVEAKGQARYWTVEDGRLLVARRLADVVAALQRPALSPAALAAMADSRASIWLSPFEGVHRLTFGHELRLTPSGPRVSRWLRAAPIPASADPAEVMRRAIEAAIDRATLDHTKATVALSGGLDSTILLALAARNPRIRDGLRAYCASPLTDDVRVPKGRYADEWPVAAAVGAHVAVPTVRLRNEAGFHWLTCADSIHDRTYLPAQAVGNLWWLRRLGSEAARHGHGLVLTGQSGNATFSNGPPSAPRPLRVDGTWEHAPVRRRHLLRRDRGGGHLPVPPSATQPDLAVTMPDHVLAMDPWLRWCLAEPLAAGTHDTATVQWHDPLGSPDVISAALSLPRTAWGSRRASRTLARAVGRGLIPEHVRRSRMRGLQGTDLPQTLLAYADDYTAAVDRVRQSPSAREFLDVDVLTTGLDLLRGTIRSATVFRHHYLRPLAVGLFAAWWDESASHRTRESAASVSR